MMFTPLLGVAFLGATLVAAMPAAAGDHQLEAHDNIYTIKTVRPKPLKAVSAALPVAANTLPLIPTGGDHGQRRLNALTKAALAQAGLPASKGVAPILAAQGGTDYVAPVDFGGQTVYLLVDTGSADTWAPQANFTCIDVMTYMPTRAANCGFRCTWDPARSKSVQRVAGQRLDVQYGDGTFARGAIVTETVTLAQIAVVGQEIGAVNYTGWTGKGGDCGILGLAYDTLDNAYPAGAPTGEATRIHYAPIFASMYRSGAIEPLFALKIGRNDTGVLSLGGVPADVKTTTPWAAAPFELTILSGTSNSSLSFYNVNMTASWGPPLSGGAAANGTNATAGGLTSGKLFQGIVDSGTTGIYLPNADAEAFNALWSPPARSDSATGSSWTVDCDAAAPQLALTIGGRAFPVSARDLVFYNGDGSCTSIVFASGRAAPRILGDAFLRNVLVVHDVGSGTLRVAGTD